MNLFHFNWDFILSYIMLNKFWNKATLQIKNTFHFYFEFSSQNFIELANGLWLRLVNFDVWNAEMKIFI